MGDTPSVRLDEGCVLICRPASDGDRHKRLLVRVAVPELEGCYQPTFHYDCPSNQLRSLVGRVAGIVPKPTGLGLAKLKLASTRISFFIPPTSANPLWDMPARYTGAKRRKYEEACAYVESQPISRKEARVKMFVKPERMDPGAKVNPDPRAIQFRDPRYCVLLASYLHPIEHHVYNISCCSSGVPRSRNVAKGLNSVGRADLFVRKSLAFDAPVYLGVDASRFDKHVSAEQLALEHAVYLRSNPHPEFQRLLSWQLNNVGISNLGLVYKVRGRRMSGDMNTAAGNCLIMLMMISAFFDGLGVPKWDCLCDGDDAVLIVEDSAVSSVAARLAPTFLDFGHEMKVEAPTGNIFQVEFCQSRIVEFQPGRFKFVRDYRAVMSKSLSGIRHWTVAPYRLRVLQAVGLCELVLNLGVPVLQAFAEAILRNVGRPSSRDIVLAPTGLVSRCRRDLDALGVPIEAVRARPVLMCARESFADAWGLPITEQRRLEAQLSLWQFDARAFRNWGPEVAVEGWVVDQTFSELFRL